MNPRLKLDIVAILFYIAAAVAVIFSVFLGFYFGAGEDPMHTTPVLGWLVFAIGIVISFIFLGLGRIISHLNSIMQSRRAE